MQGFTNAAPPSGGGLRIVASGTVEEQGFVNFSGPMKCLLLTVAAIENYVVPEANCILFPGQQFGQNDTTPKYMVSTDMDGTRAYFAPSSDYKINYIALA